jgi:hypothetical protein
VIHNVDQEKTQDIVSKYVKEAKEYVMSIEPYPQGDGYHLHLFIQYRNQRSFKSVLKELQNLSEKIISPRPDGETRAWGRVQLDIMRGTFQDCVKYLQGETKDKPTGDVSHKMYEMTKHENCYCTIRHPNRMYDPTCPKCIEFDMLREKIQWWLDTTYF